jgi:uncharacterized protein (TIGR02996 family)
VTPDDAFLQDIIESPEDDSLRLIYADWLEEQGDPRGELIRVRCRLARLADSDPQHPLLLQRERELWAARPVDWIEHGRLILTWDLALDLFRRRLAETVAWCAGQTDDLRTADLQPPANVVHFLWGSRQLWVDCSSATVQTLAATRAKLLAGRGVDPVVCEGGRLLLFWPDHTLSDGAAWEASEGFFDGYNVPPWDTWVWVSAGQEAVGHCPGLSYLVSWVPPHLIERADWGISVNPEQCIMWAADVETPLTSRLREAGLLT